MDRGAGCRIAGGRGTQRPGGLRKTAPSLERLEARRLLANATNGSAAGGDGPTVVAVERFGFHHKPTVLVLQFNQPLDPGRAQNTSNYVIRNFKSRPVFVASAVYDPANLTVTVQPRPLINLHHPTQLLVMGTPPTGVTNTAGVLLDGANTGRPGSDFSTFVTRRNLAGPAPPTSSPASSAPATVPDFGQSAKSR
jgi:hypothetical protein